jgi:hypothetical protein
MPIRYVTTTIRTDALSAPKPQALGTMAIVGEATAGAYNTAQLFSNSNDAVSTYGSGALINAINAAFAQSPGPTEIWAVRESSSNASYTDTLTQSTGGNKEFQISSAIQSNYTIESGGPHRFFYNL